MLRDLLKASLIHLISFQLLYMGVFSDMSNTGLMRGPASFDHKYSLEELNTLMNEFKGELKGKELQPDCGEAAEGQLTEEELMLQSLFADDTKIITREERAFFNYVDSLKQNSCGGAADEVPAPVQEEKCKVEKQEGYIDQVVSQIMQLEKDEKEPAPLKLDDPKVREFHQKAQMLMGELRKYLADTSIEKEKRVELLVNYLGSVALPMRDFIVVLRGYIPREYDGVYFYESLLPEINAEIIGDDELTKDMILHGPNKMIEDYHLKIEEKRWGRMQLVYDKNTVLARDIIQLMKAPTAKNYVRASKWMTLQMMLTQAFTYDAMLGETKPLPIPNSCQNHFNGSLPDEMEMEFNAEEGDAFLDRILANQGLIMSEGDTQYAEYYMDSVNKNPMMEGYSGLMPFENYKAAMLGLKELDNRHLKPVIDDYSGFEDVKGFVLNKGLQVFQDDNRYLFGLIDFEDDNYFGSNLVQKLFTQPEVSEVYEFNDEDGEPIEIGHVRQNLSTFMTELMQRHKVEYWEELITPELKSHLERRPLRLAFPSLHGATVWRMWALRQLEEFVNKYENAELPTKIGTQLSRSLNSRSGDHWITSGRTAKDKLENLKKYLKELKVGDEYTPTRTLTTGEHYEGYKVLGTLWNNLSRYTEELPASRTNEFEYLRSQMENGNPWARVRLSYLLLMDELSAIKQGDLPRYSKASFSEFNGEKINSCKKRDVNTISQKIASSARKMGIHRTLEPAYATKLLEDREKQMVWSNVVEQASPLFKQQDTRGKPFYEMMERTSNQTFLSKDKVLDFVREHIHKGIHDQAWDEIEAVFSSPAGETAQFFAELYSLRGNPEEQLEYFEAHSLENGIDNSYQAKLGFLMIDNAVKRSMLKSLLRRSAQLRKNEIMGELERFCNLEPTDHESFKTLYFATTKAQNQLNQLTGAPTIPRDVMEGIEDKVNSMSAEEWTDVWLGLGAAALGIAGMAIGAACTGITGGLCAPLGVAMVAMGAGALTMQLSLVSRELNRKLDADLNEAQVLSMEKLGFADMGASDSVARGWTWTIIEAVSVIPLIGVTARAIRVGSKLTVVSTGMLARNAGKHGFKEAWRMTSQAGKVVVSEADTRFARLVLGLDTFADQSADVLKAFKNLGAPTRRALEQLSMKGVDKTILRRAFDRIRGLKQLYAAGQLSPYALAKRIGQIISRVKKAATASATRGMTYTSNVVVKETPDMIDKQTAKIVSEYFSGNPKGMHYLMKTYASRVPKAIKAMERYEKGTSLLGKITLLPWIRNGIRSLRSSQIAKYSEQILRIEKELAEVVAKKGNLEEYILKNVDDLTDIFVQIPVRMREVPYMIAAQGGPHLGKSISSVKTFTNVGGHYFSNGLVMRKFFNARSRLIYESMKEQARGILGLKTFVASETTLEAVKAFQHSVAHASEKITGEAKENLLKQYAKYQDDLASKLAQHVRQNIDSPDALESLKQSMFKGDQRLKLEFSELNEAAMKRILFEASTEQERAIASVIWSSMKPEQLFELHEIGDVAHRVIRELAEYDNVDEFQALLNALKVLVIKRNPGVVEVM